MESDKLWFTFAKCMVSASVGRVMLYQWIVQAFDINPNGLIMRVNAMPSSVFPGNAGVLDIVGSTSCCGVRR